LKGDRHLSDIGSEANNICCSYDRPIEKVLMDVKNEFISISQAEKDYGVIIDHLTLKEIGLTEVRKKHHRKI